MTIPDEEIIREFKGNKNQHYLKMNDGTTESRNTSQIEQNGKRAWQTFGALSSWHCRGSRRQAEQAAKYGYKLPKSDRWHQYNIPESLIAPLTVDAMRPPVSVHYCLDVPTVYTGLWAKWTLFPISCFCQVFFLSQQQKKELKCLVISNNVFFFLTPQM